MTSRSCSAASWASSAGVERLGEAGVGDRDVEAVLGQQVGGAERLADAGAVADDRDALALAQDLARPDLEQRRASPADRHADRLAARVADRRRARRARSAVCSMWTSIASSRGAISVMLGSGRR